MKKAHIGQSVEEFFAELGELEEVRALAAKKMVVLRLSRLMTDRGISKPELAKRMETSRSAVARLLDPSDTAVTLATLARAAALDLELDVSFRSVGSRTVKKTPAVTKALAGKRGTRSAAARSAKKASARSHRSFSR